MLYSYYTPILFLQAFCIYHAYRNNTHQKWMWLIIFVPLIGCLIYLYDNFASRRNFEDVQEGVKHMMSSNYQLKKLEKENKYAATVTNKVKLADAYVQNGRFAEAIELYLSCQHGLYAEDPELDKKLLHAYYLQKDYDAVLNCGKRLLMEKSFKNSDARVAYAWSLQHLGDTTEADANFRDMDIQFSNYSARIEYCQFLRNNQRTAEAKTKLEDMMDEIDHMDTHEQRMKKPILRRIKQLYASITSEAAK